MWVLFGVITVATLVLGLLIILKNIVEDFHTHESKQVQDGMNEAFKTGFMAGNYQNYVSHNLENCNRQEVYSTAIEKRK